MTITAKEAKRRAIEAQNISAASRVLSDWYWCLVKALEEQEESGAPDLDLSTQWLTGYSPEYLNQTLHSQLAEYGVTATVYPGYSDLGLGVRVYFLKPDQVPMEPSRRL